jgi:Icc-related predicted phosphoesterase
MLVKIKKQWNQAYWGQIGKKTLYILFALLIFAFFLSTWGEMKSSFGPFDLRLNFQWGWPGETRLIIPPLGEIKAETHHWPVVLSATIDRIDIALLQHELLGITDTNQYISGFTLRLKESIYLFLAKLCLVGGIAGGAVALIFGWRHFQRLWRMIMAGMLLVLFVIGGVMADYNQEAFNNPRYEGALEAAPWALSLIDQGLSRLPEFSKKLSIVAGNLDSLFSQVDNLSPLAMVEGELKVLHVSDIHNNPAALEFIQKVIDGFGVDLLIDTGDLTDYGTMLEAELNRKINNLGVKYLFIPGNHDSSEVISRLRKYKNVIVMTKRIYEFKGLTIMGWEDPAVRNPETLMTGDAKLKAEAEKLEEYLENAGTKIDILAVHNRKLSSGVEGQVPVIVHGHDHKPGITETGNTVFINAGTTGAAGVRGLANDSIPYSVALLRFNRTAGEYQLAAVDLIRVYSIHGKFILERKVISQPKKAD